VRSLGIDVGVDKGLDLVLLDDARVLLQRHRGVSLDDLGALIENAGPDIIAIDAPPRWGSPGGGSRLTEREIRRFGIQSFGTPSEDRGDGNRFYEWMRRGFQVFSVAERGGFLPYAPPGSPRGKAIEVFPHASAVVLAGCLPPRGATTGRAKREWRRRVLETHGVLTEDLRSTDQVDAALAALTGLYALAGRCFAPGDPKEGVIVLPATALPPPPYPRCREPERKDDGRQLVIRGLARCACGAEGCRASTSREFAPGHDAKRKALLWRLARSGQDATDELRRRGWELPPEMG
jgi:predicted nuclease with RNAse H fold